MNDYGFDYMNYVMNIPNGMFHNNNYITNNKINPKKTNFLDPYSGFVKGNIFDNLYNSYKNYEPLEIDVNNENEALMYQIMQYKFNLVDLDLYLDTNPNDKNAINLYNKYLSIEKQMCDKYENMYGPLSLDSADLTKNGWAWVDGSWPWEVR